MEKYLVRNFCRNCWYRPHHQHLNFLQNFGCKVNFVFTFVWLVWKEPSENAAVVWFGVETNPPHVVNKSVPFTIKQLPIETSPKQEQCPGAFILKETFSFLCFFVLFLPEFLNNPNTSLKWILKISTAETSAFTRTKPGLNTDLPRPWLVLIRDSTRPLHRLNQALTWTKKGLNHILTWT